MKQLELCMLMPTDTHQSPNYIVD